MKKFLLTLSLLFCSFIALPKQKFNKRTKKFYTVPKCVSIDQEEYHALCLECGAIMERLNLEIGYFDPVAVAVNWIAYLEYVGTPAAKRLLRDFHLIND